MLVSTISEIKQTEQTEIKSVNPYGNQPQIFIGRAVVEAEAPILWSPDVKSPLTRKGL